MNLKLTENKLATIVGLANTIDKITEDEDDAVILSIAVLAHLIKRHIKKPMDDGFFEIIN